MQNIIIVGICDVYYSLNVRLGTEMVLGFVFLFSILFFSAGLWFQEKKAEVTKKAEVVLMRRNRASTWVASHYE